MKFIHIFILVTLITQFKVTNIISQDRQSPRKFFDVEVDIQKSNSLKGDFNGDLITDFAYFDGYQWKIIFRNPALHPEEQIVKCADGQTTGNGVYEGDFNGDGISDKLTFIERIDRSAPEYRNQGPGAYVSYSQRSEEVISYSFQDESKWSDTTGNPNIDLNAVGDFNGDGLSDVIVFNKNRLKALINDYNKARFLFRERFKTVIWYDNLPSNREPVKLIAGDFIDNGNLDNNGFDDLGIVYSTNDVVSILCLKSDGSKFIQLNEIELGKGIDPANIFIEDINLNGRKDIIYNQPGESVSAALSVFSYDGQRMKSFPGQFKSSSNANEKIMWMGDFDGDGLTEGIVKKNVLGKSTGLTKPEILISPINNFTSERKVGVYLSLSYYIGGEIVDGWNIRDFGKTPIVGWGSDQVEGIYSSQDIKTLALQIKAMKKSGIDFIIADISNGWADIYKPWPVLGKGAGIPKNALDKLFTAAKAESMQVAIMLGLEFQGPIRFTKWKGAWDGWENQYQRIDIVTQEVKKIIKKFPDTYFYHQGKPLLPVFLNEGYDYPPRDLSTNKPIPRWFLPEFTIRYVVGPYSTYDRENPVYNREFEGMNSKRFWGWGSGHYDVEDPEHSIKLPVNFECMSVMPGQRFWNKENNPAVIGRRGGEFYIRSWKQVLEVNPEIVLIADWNNWIEETAIENCAGPNGWKDRKGNPTPDWYLKITRKYAKIFKSQILPTDEPTWVRETGENTIYKYDGNTNKLLDNGRRVDTLEANYQDELRSTQGYPTGEPDILLPKNWLKNKGYLRQ